MSTTYAKFYASNGTALTAAGGVQWALVEASDYDATLQSVLAQARANGTTASVTVPIADSGVAAVVQAAVANKALGRIEVATYDDDDRLTSDYTLIGSAFAEVLTSDYHAAPTQAFAAAASGYYASLDTYDAAGNQATTRSGYNLARKAVISSVPASVFTAPASPATLAAAATADRGTAPFNGTFLALTDASGHLISVLDPVGKDGDFRLDYPDGHEIRVGNEYLSLPTAFVSSLTTGPGGASGSLAFSVVSGTQDAALFKALASGQALKQVEVFQAGGSSNRTVNSDTVFANLLVTSETVLLTDHGSIRTFQLQTAGGAYTTDHYNTSGQDTSEGLTLVAATPGADQLPIIPPDIGSTHPDYTITVGTGSGAVSGTFDTAQVTATHVGSYAGFSSLTVVFSGAPSAALQAAIQAGTSQTITLQQAKAGVGTVYDTLTFRTEGATASPTIGTAADGTATYTYQFNVGAMQEVFQTPPLPHESNTFDSGGWNRIRNVDGTSTFQSGDIALTVTGIAATPSASGPLNAGKSVSFAVSVSQAVAVRGSPTLRLSNGATAAFVSATPTVLTFGYTVAAGQDTAALVATGLSLNGATLAVPASRPITIDTVAPTLTITSDTPQLRAGQTALITFRFSEDPGSSFTWNGTDGDVAVTGGTLSAIAGTGLTRTAVFTPTAGVNAGTASITVAASRYADLAGNNGGTGTTPSLSFDTLPPTVAITSPGNPNGQARQIVTGTAAVSEAGRSVAVLDGGLAAGTATVQADGTWQTYVTFQTAGDHVLAASLTDLAGNVGSSNGVTYRGIVLPSIVTASRSTTLGAGQTGLVLTGPALTGAGLTGTGNDLANVIQGSAGNDLIYGLGGNDDLRGNAGDDTLDGGSGDDALYGGDGNDRLLGGADNDTLSGGTGADTLSGGDGNDRLDGGIGADSMDGGAGDDVYDVDDVGDVVTELANEGRDMAYVGVSGWTVAANLESVTLTVAGLLTGNGDANQVLGSGGNDTVYGLDGNDDLRGYAGNDVLDGGLGNDNLYGGDGQDSLLGGVGNDTIRGEAGDDTLAGGAGNDLLLGGTGADLFVWGTDALGGADVVSDFSRADGDKLDLSALHLTQVATHTGAGQFTLTYVAASQATVVNAWSAGNAGAAADLSITAYAAGTGQLTGTDFRL